MLDKKRKYEKAAIWEKDNAVRYSFKLLKSNDSDIIEYLQDKPKQTTFKKAIRLLIKTETENN